jgi:hypothetical protein
MTSERRDFNRVPRRYAERPRSASAVRASQRSRYARGPVQSTKALTTKLVILAVVGSLLIGGLIAAQMASGNDPALGPKAVARAKKASAKPASNSSSTSSSNGAGGSDPYGQSYNSDPYYYGGSSDYGGSSGYSDGSSGYSGGSSGYSSGSGSSSGSTYSAPPVTSSTS